MDLEVPCSSQGGGTIVPKRVRLSAGRESSPPSAHRPVSVALSGLAWRVFAGAGRASAMSWRIAALARRSAAGGLPALPVRGGASSRRASTSTRSRDRGRDDRRAGSSRSEVQGDAVDVLGRIAQAGAERRAEQGQADRHGAGHRGQDQGVLGRTSAAAILQESQKLQLHTAHSDAKKRRRGEFVDQIRARMEPVAWLLGQWR